MKRSAPLLALAALLVCAGAALAAPRVTVMPPEIDFGTLEQHQVREGALTIYNNGDEALEILDVKSTCGCTVAKPAVSTIPPGESTTLNVTFDSKAFQGQQHKPVSIVTNDPDRREVEIMVTAFVDVPVMVYPPHKSVSFNRVTTGTSADQSVGFEATGDRVLALEVSRAREDLFEIAVRPTPGNPARQEAVITVKPDAPIGSFREIVSFKTGVEDQPFIDIETNGNVSAPLQLHPGNVNFRYVGPGRELTRVFSVKAHDGRAVNVTRAEVELPGFRVESVETEERTGLVKVRVVGTPLPMSDERVVAAKGRMKGQLVVYLDDPDVPELRADIKYMLKL